MDVSGKEQFSSNVCFCLGRLNSNLWLIGGEVDMAWPNATHIDLYHPYFLCIWYPRPPLACWKPSLFLYCCLSQFLSLSLSIFSLCLSPLLLLSGHPKPPISLGSRPHYLDTLCKSCHFVNQSVCGPEVRINLPRPMWKSCGITSTGKGHPLSAQKWFCQHIQVPGEPRCNDLIFF